MSVIAVKSSLSLLKKQSIIFLLIHISSFLVENMNGIDMGLCDYYKKESRFPSLPFLNIHSAFLRVNTRQNVRV